LFILDDFGYQKSGSYYLAENGDFELETAISALIDLLRRQLSPKSSIYLGSSKGGYAALYYGLTHEAEHIIIGAPQYYLGQYLDTEKHRPILNGIMGNDSKGSIQKLDNLLHNKIFSSKGIKSKVYVHYSKNEHTYEEHIKDLIKDLRENEIECIEDIKDFLNHSDVSKHFPAFLNEVIKKINKKEPIKV
jgi:predicted esterase